MKKCGIYFCLHKGEVIYIGKTTDFITRLVGHVALGLDLEYDKVRLIECDESKLDYYEKRWIKRFRPIENYANNRPRKKYNYYQKKLRPNGKAVLKNNFKMKFRIMTEKSIIGFGKFSDTKVGHLMSVDRLHDVAIMYYNLSHISFCEDLLIKLKITDEWRIQKPGTNKELGQKFLDTFYPDQVEKWKRRKDILINKNAKRVLNGEIRNSTAERGRMRNHGNI